MTKLDNPSGATEATGAQVTDLGTRKKLGGAEFKLCLVDQALVTNDDIVAASKLDVATAAIKTDYAENGFAAGCKTLSTSEAATSLGEAKFTDLKVGVYTLTETKAPKGYVASKPGLVFIPMTDPATHNTWMYDVYVYPKNSKVGVDKKVSDTDKQVGQDVTYDVTADVPALAAAADFKGMRFDDLLDKRLSTTVDKISLLAYKGTTAVPSLALARDTDYKVQVYANQGDNHDQQKIVLVLTTAGLKKVADARVAGTIDKLDMRFDATVNGSGVILNTAQVYTNAGSGAGYFEPGPDTPPDTPPTPPTDTPTVYSAWGKVEINKFATGVDHLAGAEFDLYQCSGTDAAPKLEGTPLTVNNKNHWVTTADATTVIDGIHVTDYANNAPIPTVTKTYCLVETKAPSGYELLAKPVKFNLTVGAIAAGSGPKQVNEVATLSVTKDIENVKYTPKLPLTGGAGVAAFGLIGLAIIAGGATWMKRRAKA